MPTEIIITIIGLISTILGYLFGYKENRNKAKQGEADAYKSAVEAYQIIINDLRNQVDLLIKKQDNLETTVDNMKNNVCYENSCTKRKQKK